MIKFAVRTLVESGAPPLVLLPGQDRVRGKGHPDPQALMFSNDIGSTGSETLIIQAQPNPHTSQHPMKSRRINLIIWTVNGNNKKSLSCRKIAELLPLN